MSLNDLFRRIRGRKSKRPVVDQALPDKEQGDVESDVSMPAPVAKSGLVFFGKPEKVFDLEDLMRADAEVLGKGTMGTSYKAVLENGWRVRVKRLRDVVLNADEFREMVESIWALQHENLLSPRAYYYSKGEKLLLCDYMPQKSLSLALHGSNREAENPLTWESSYNIALGVAHAIEYLHSRGPGVFHGNIKSSNVLLTESYEVLVSDYGLACLRGKDAPHTNKWSAHRLWQFPGDPHEEDVYSFGMFLLELLTESPDSSLEEHMDPQEWATQAFDDEFLPLRFPNSAEGTTELLKVAVACTSQNPKMLPPMSQVRQMIENLHVSARALRGESSLLHSPRTLRGLLRPPRKLRDESSLLQPEPKPVNQVSDFTEYFDYFPSLYSPENDCDIAPPQAVAPHPTCNTDSKLSTLDPASHHSSFDYPVSSIMVSKSTEPEIEKCDPVLTGGVYDLSLSNGKPLPPSEEICYPHSLRDLRDELGLELHDPVPCKKLLPQFEDISCPHSITDQHPRAVNFIQNGVSSPMVDSTEDAQAKTTEDGNKSKSTKELRNLARIRNSEHEELQAEEQAVYSMRLSPNEKSSAQENKVQRPPSKNSLDAAVDETLASSNTASESASSSGNLEFEEPGQPLLLAGASSPEGENVPIQKLEERIAPITETNLKVTSDVDCASSMANNSGNPEATAAHVHGIPQVPDTNWLREEEPCLQGDSSSFTSMSSGYDYDVFLSFRGPDTRSCIADFLYTSLLAAGIHTYRDDEELRIGEEIGPELLKAINQTKISIPIFSSGYASSKWCLTELAQMVECRKTRRQKIMPIFYNITPCDVRHQTGSYQEAFVSHEDHFDHETINKWKAALSEVGKLKGWDISTKINRREGELVKQIVQEAIDELKKAYLLVTDFLVGVDSHVKEINRMVTHGNLEDVRVLLIHGMGGVGKTTLAKLIYNRLTHCFEDRCFLSNIRETSELKGIEHLQKQLISNILKRDWSEISNVDEGIKMIKDRLCGKKVLVLLDDVDKAMLLNALMGNPAWFGSGSRIIITSRNRDLISMSEVNHEYELVSMDFGQSLQLFCKFAFGSDYPPDEYATFSREVVRITGGLPLALEVIGLLLSGKSKDVWDVTLKKLAKVPHDEIKKKLKISYDTLDDRQKQMFLDIACLFVGFDKRVVHHLWDNFNLFPGEGLEVLQRMSLIKIENENKLWMHVLLRDLGKDIVRQQCNMELEKQTRLWDHEEALDVVVGKKGTREVEALCLKLDYRLLYYFASEEFSRLSNLRYLEIRHVQNDWPSYGYPINLLRRNLPIFSKLRWLSWHNFPLVLKLTYFSHMNIVILDLSWSKFTESWDGWSHLKMAMNLKVLNLTGCAHLNATPDFSANVKLEHLIFQNCGRLAHIDKSIGKLKQLMVLDLRFCNKLSKLPKELDSLESLKKLLIDGTSITEIPGWGGMKKLETLSACQNVVLRVCLIGHKGDKM